MEQDPKNNEDAEFQPEPAAKQGFIGELWDFLRVRKKFWLAPIILALAFLGMLFFLAGGAGVLSPFNYML